LRTKYLNFEPACSCSPRAQLYPAPLIVRVTERPDHTRSGLLVCSIIGFSILATTSVQPLQNEWQYNHTQKKDTFENSFRDGMIAPGERPSDHNPYENCEAKNNKPWRGFHALTLSRAKSVVPSIPGFTLGTTGRPTVNVLPRPGAL
jgi:hypothetical protein